MSYCALTMTHGLARVTSRRRLNPAFTILTFGRTSYPENTTGELGYGNTTGTLGVCKKLRAYAGRSCGQQWMRMQTFASGKMNATGMSNG